jgi:hypothetical protein
MRRCAAEQIRRQTNDPIARGILGVFAEDAIQHTDLHPEETDEN